MIPRITTQNINDPETWDEFEAYGFGFFEISPELQHSRQYVKDNFHSFFGHPKVVENFPPSDVMPHCHLVDHSKAEKPFSGIELEMSVERLFGFVDTPHTKAHLAMIRSTLMTVGELMAGRWQRFVRPSFFSMEELDETFKAMYFPSDRDHLDGTAPSNPSGLLNVVDVFNHKTLQYWDPLLLNWRDLVQPENHVTVFIGDEFRETIGPNKIMAPLIRVNSCPLNSLMIGYSVTRNQSTPVTIEDDDKNECEFQLVPRTSHPIVSH